MLRKYGLFKSAKWYQKLPCVGVNPDTISPDTMPPDTKAPNKYTNRSELTVKPQSQTVSTVESPTRHYATRHHVTKHHAARHQTTGKTFPKQHVSEKCMLPNCDEKETNMSNAHDDHHKMSRNAWVNPLSKFDDALLCSCHNKVIQPRRTLSAVLLVSVHTFFE